MTYADDYNLRTTSVKFNDIADAIDGSISRQYAPITTGTSSAYIASPTPAWQEYTTSSIIIVTPHVTNAAGATIQINSLPAKELKIAGVAIGAGIIQQGIPTVLAFNGVHFEVLLQNVSIPTGQITAFAGATAPTGWLLCDGTDYATGDYPALHGVIGTTYNKGGEAVGRFRVPDLLRRFAVGKGVDDTLGNAEGGTKAGTAYASRIMSHSHGYAHTHTIQDHQHTVPDHSHAIGTHTHIVNSHSHTVNSHSHPLSDAGAAKLTLDSTDTYASRIGTAAWTRTFTTSPDQAWASSSATHNTGIGLIGNTDAASPGTSLESGSTQGPNAGATTGGVTAFQTNTGEGGVSTNSQSTSTSDSTTLPHLFVNYIIKT